MFHNSLVHGLAANHGRDRRILLLIEMVLRWAKMSRFRESAMLLRGHDVYGNFEDAPRPDGKCTETALAKWRVRRAHQAPRPRQQLRAERGVLRSSPPATSADWPRRTLIVRRATITMTLQRLPRWRRGFRSIDSGAQQCKHPGGDP
jgi:hypothetical protein